MKKTMNYDWIKEGAILLGVLLLAYLFFQPGIVANGVFMRQTKNQDGIQEYAYGFRKISFQTEGNMTFVTVSGSGTQETYRIKEGFGNHITIYQGDTAIADGSYTLNVQTGKLDTGVHFIDSAYQGRFLNGYRQDFPHQNTGAVHPTTLLTLLYSPTDKRGVTMYMLGALLVGGLVWFDSTKRGYLTAASYSADGSAGAKSRFTGDVMAFTHASVTRGGGMYVAPAAMNYLSKTNNTGEFASAFHDVPTKKPNVMGQRITWVVFGLLALWLLAKAFRLL